MGRKYTTIVWKQSKTVGNDRLVLLAIADHADDKGRAWPGIQRLADMTKISYRHCRRIVHKLQDEYAELIIDEGKGRSKTHIYTILLNSETENSNMILLDNEKGDIKGDILSQKEDITMSPFEGDEDDIKGDILSQKGDIIDIKEDILNGKEDTVTSPESIKQSVKQSIKQSITIRRFNPFLVDLPNCVDPALWNDWCVFRNYELKDPLTPNTVKQQLALLTANAEQANDILCRSMANSWRNLYPF